MKPETWVAIYAAIVGTGAPRRTAGSLNFRVPKRHTRMTYCDTDRRARARPTNVSPLGLLGITGERCGEPRYHKVNERRPVATSRDNSRQRLHSQDRSRSMRPLFATNTPAILEHPAAFSAIVRRDTSTVGAYGPALLGITGLGLFSYGAFELVQTFARRLNAKAVTTSAV